MIRIALMAGAFFGFSGVAMGAFAAHGLKAFLHQNGYAQTFETAVRFEFYHAFALLITGILLHLRQDRLFEYAAVCFTMGTLFFSGSLFALSLTGLALFGPITPIGGTLLIIGWSLLLVGSFGNKKAS